MRYLTTPWRMKYVVSTSEQKGCIFCELLARKETDEAKHILARGRDAFLVLNLYPYTPGHLLAVPYRHVSSVAELTGSEMDEILALCGTGEKLLRRAFGCRSVHVGANVGRAAGAGIPGHLHFHIVVWPAGHLWERWANAEEPPESLAEIYSRLCAAAREK